MKLYISEPSERYIGPILVHDEDHNDIAEFYHNEHATVGQSYETALALAQRLVTGNVPQTLPEILEASEDLAGHQIMTVRSDRGDEYVIDADAAVKALAQLFSNYDNEQRHGWTLAAPWFELEFAHLRTFALSRHHGGRE